MTNAVGPPSCPEEVLSRYGGPGAEPTLAYHLDPSSAVWRLDARDVQLYVKVRSWASRHRLADEGERLAWLAPFVLVPAVVEVGGNAEVEWLITEGVGGVSGSDRTAALRKAGVDPTPVVVRMAEALRDFHARVPIESCPFDFRLDAALGYAEARLASAVPDKESAREIVVEAEEFGLTRENYSVEEAVGVLLRHRPDREDVVACHGDYCFPNVLFADDLAVTGYIDAGGLALADRWWDLAIGTWSTTWNCGPGYERAFLRAYGVEPDVDRIRYYRLLYGLV